jgi:putative glutamine amidotransferase
MTEGAKDLADAAAELLEAHKIDGLLLTGGGDVDPALYGGDEDGAILVDRERDEFEMALIQCAISRGVPVLGICRGCQILNVAFGGTLRDLRHDDALNDAHFTFGGHPVTIAPESRLTGILGAETLENVLSFHRQAVDQPGDPIRVVARGPEDVVEAIEAGDVNRDWAIAVQWHPEMVPVNPLHGKLFRAFVERASASAATRRV